MTRLAPIHPGSVLAAEFLEPLRLDARQLAERLGLEPQMVRSLLAQTGSVTAEIALRLARCFGTSPELWMNLQQAYDLSICQDRLGERILREVSPVSGDR